MKLARRIAMETTARQSTYCWRASGVRRKAWNWALGRWHEDWDKAKAETDPDKRKALWPSASKLKAEWNEVRRSDFPYTLDVTKCAGTQAILDLGRAFEQARKEHLEAKTQGRKPRKQFSFPTFKAKNRTTPSFRIWNDQFSVTNHYSVYSKPYATVHLPHIGEVRLAEPMPGMGGILGATISYRRGRWFIAFQFDQNWNDGEQSDKAARIAQGKARKQAITGGIPAAEAKATIAVTSNRPDRILPRHARPGTIGGGDLGLIDAFVGHVEASAAGPMPLVDLASPNAIHETLRVANPRRLARTERQTCHRKRLERRLARSIRKARERTAAEAKRKMGDVTPVTTEDIRYVKHRLSNRQRRLGDRLVKADWAQADRRDDFLHKTALAIARSAEVLVLEDLHVKGMLANRNLAKSLSDAALGRLGTYIAYKAERAGGLVLWAPRFFPSSKRCSACGHILAELELGQRVWVCSACGVAHNRDANAAANLCWLGRLAVGTDMIPPEAASWSAWIEQARAAAAAWRETQRRSSIMRDAFVGAACPDSRRGEVAYRGPSDQTREPTDEPRTTPVGSPNA